MGLDDLNPSRGMWCLELRTPCRGALDLLAAGAFWADDLAAGELLKSLWVRDNGPGAVDRLRDKATCWMNDHDGPAVTKTRLVRLR